MQALTENHRGAHGNSSAIYRPRYRRGCPAVALQSRILHYMAAGFVLRIVKRRQARYKLEEVGAKGKLWHKRPTGLTFSL